MRKQDYPPYYQMLIKLGLGIIGGVVHIFCLPVLANMMLYILLWIL